MDCTLTLQRPVFKKKNTSNGGLLQRLQAREISRGRPGTVHLQNRQFYQNIYPNHAVYNVDAPSCHIKKFTNDGEHLVCFSKNLQGIQLYQFKGVSNMSDCDTPSDQKFETYFTMLYEKFLANNNEVLCRDFCLQTNCGNYFIFASSGPTTSPISSPHLSSISHNLPNFPDSPSLSSDSFSTLPSSSHFSLSASTDAFPPVAMSHLEDITFYLVGRMDGHVYDKRVFKNDFIHLSHHSGVYLHQDLFAVLSVHTQTIHLFQIQNGKFIDARTIGHQCYEDDDLELACVREQERKYEQAQGTTPAPEDHQDTDAHLFIPPLPLSLPGRPQSSTFFDAKSSLGIPIQSPSTSSSVDLERERIREREFSMTAGPIVGIKQRLLSYLLRQAQESPSPAKALTLFYQQFDQYSSLVMWKMQLLDSSHLLIKFGNVDGVVKGHQGDSASQQNAFFVVYDMYSTEILGVFENSSKELADTFEQFCDHFRVCGNVGSLQFRATCANNPFVKEQLQKQKLAVANARNGGEMQAVKRVLSALPFSPQTFSESPYFDKSLFNYDEKLISATERPKPCAEFPIKFYSRNDGVVQFKLNPGIPDKSDRSKKFASYVFHPTSPFIISVQHSLFNAPIVNLHVRR